jgi:glycosyltransferase involved in cell wall biosynthesis
MVIHIIGTINGQVNEGMRKIATHLAKAFAKENTVLYSGLKDVPKIFINSRQADVTMIFARANKMVYQLASLVTKLCKNTWIVLVQRPDAEFIARNDKRPLKCNYISITESDMKDVKILSGKRRELFSVGIKSDKFSPVTRERQNQLKEKYRFDSQKPLVIHVGHCSKGRGLEDFAQIKTAQCMVIASGMFEDENVVHALNRAGVKIHKGYLENVEEVYQMADAYFFPTRSAEFVISVPLSVMEALSCGVPVVGYKSFENLNEIRSELGSITLIDNAEQLDDVLPAVMKKKSSHSLLVNTDSWDEVAESVLGILWEDFA